MAMLLAAMKMSLDLLFDQMTETRGALLARPITAPMAADFDSFLITWRSVLDQELALRKRLSETGAAIKAADADLDAFVVDFSHTLLILTKGSRTAPLYMQYFGAQTASQVTAPTLGDELTTTAAWVSALHGSSDPALVAYGDRLEPLVAAANGTVAAQAQADTDWKAFRAVGARKALFDQANSLRSDTEGKLSKLAFDHPELHLPTTFASEFFRKESRSSKNPKFAAIDDEIETLQLRIQSLQERRAEVTADVAAAAKAKEDADAADAQAAAAKQKAKDERTAAKKAKADAKDKDKAAKAAERKARRSKNGK